MFYVDATCMVWGGKCGTNGNCWLYDGMRLKYYLNFTGASKYSCNKGIIYVSTITNNY